ncbi:unnamed protein product, partial [Ectocarpus sp. 8 AP-2014]
SKQGDILTSFLSRTCTRMKSPVHASSGRAFCVFSAPCMYSSRYPRQVFVFAVCLSLDNRWDPRWERPGSRSSPPNGNREAFFWHDEDG